MKKNHPGINLQRRQAELREHGLLAEPHEPWISPAGLRLDAMPETFHATRRQRNDRVPQGDPERIGLTSKPKQGRPKR